MFLSSEIYLSIEEIAPRQGRRSSIEGKQNSLRRNFARFRFENRRRSYRGETRRDIPDTPIYPILNLTFVALRETSATAMINANKNNPSSDVN